MKKMIRSQIVLAAVVLLAGVFCFAARRRGNLQSQVRHVPRRHRHAQRGNGQGNGHQAGLRSVDQALTVAQIEATVKSGKGKMKPVAGLTDAQVKDVAAYFKTLK